MTTFMLIMLVESVTLGGAETLDSFVLGHGLSYADCVAELTENANNTDSDYIGFICTKE